MQLIMKVVSFSSWKRKNLHSHFLHYGDQKNFTPKTEQLTIITLDEFFKILVPTYQYSFCSLNTIKMYIKLLNTIIIK